MAGKDNSQPSAKRDSFDNRYLDPLRHGSTPVPVKAAEEEEEIYQELPPADDPSFNISKSYVTPSQPPPSITILPAKTKSEEKEAYQKLQPRPYSQSTTIRQDYETLLRPKSETSNRTEASKADVPPSKAATATDLHSPFKTAKDNEKWLLLPKSDTSNRTEVSKSEVPPSKVAAPTDLDSSFKDAKDTWEPLPQKSETNSHVKSKHKDDAPSRILPQPEQPTSSKASKKAGITLPPKSDPSAHMKGDTEEIHVPKMYTMDSVFEDKYSRADVDMLNISPYPYLYFEQRPVTYSAKVRIANNTGSTISYKLVTQSNRKYKMAQTTGLLHKGQHISIPLSTKERPTESGDKLGIIAIKVDRESTNEQIEQEWKKAIDNRTYAKYKLLCLPSATSGPYHSISTSISPKHSHSASKCKHLASKVILCCNWLGLVGWLLFVIILLMFIGGFWLRPLLLEYACDLCGFCSKNVCTYCSYYFTTTH